MPLSITRPRMESLLKAAADKRVLVVGDAMLDEYLVGDVERISPEAPVPVVRVRERRQALGGATNVAENVIAAGASCRLVATAGRDSPGERIASLLKEHRIDATGLIRIDRPTTLKTRIVARSQQLVRVDEEDSSDLGVGDLARVIAEIEKAIPHVDAVVLEDYNKGVLVPKVIEHAIALARKRGIPIVVDPKYRHFFSYKGATVFKPNRRELGDALGAAVDLEHPEALGRTMKKLEVDNLLLTLGEHGMALVSGDNSFKTVPTTAREVYDVSGAGDTVTAYLAVVLAAGGNVEEAAVIANYAAGVEVGKSGAATVSPEEILEAFDDHATR